MLSTIITQHAATQAAAGNWIAVAESLNAQTIVVRDDTPLTYARIAVRIGETARGAVAATMRLIAASESPLAGEISDAHTVMLDENVGMRISSDARQTIIDQIAAAGNWPESLKVAVKSLGKRAVSPAAQAGLGVVTAEQCSLAWIVGSDVLLSINRRGGDSRVCLQVFRDGAQIRIATLEDGHGSTADRSLISAIETAIDAWLQKGG